MIHIRIRIWCVICKHGKFGTKESTWKYVTDDKVRGNISITTGFDNYNILLSQAVLFFLKVNSIYGSSFKVPVFFQSICFLKFLFFFERTKLKRAFILLLLVFIMFEMKILTESLTILIVYSFFLFDFVVFFWFAIYFL